MLMFMYWAIRMPFIWMVTVIYFLPSVRAWKNGCRHAHWRRLLLLNGLLGWTGICWWQTWKRARWSSPMIFAGKAGPAYLDKDAPPPLRAGRIALAVSGALLAIALVVMGH
jgi:hypothetical protein